MLSILMLPSQSLHTGFLFKVDLNGDGKPEVLVAAPNGQVQLLAPARPGDGFARVRVRGRLGVTLGRTACA